MEYAIFALFVGYLTPWIAAVAREHEQHLGILLASLLVGWTVVGWFAVLAYALGSNPRSLAAPVPRNFDLIQGGARVRTAPRGRGPRPLEAGAPPQR